MRKLAFLLALSSMIGCASEIRNVPYTPTYGTYRRAMLDADKCKTPTAWAQRVENTTDSWFGVCGDAYGNELTRYVK